MLVEILEILVETNQQPILIPAEMMMMFFWQHPEREMTCGSKHPQRNILEKSQINIILTKREAVIRDTKHHMIKAAERNNLRIRPQASMAIPTDRFGKDIPMDFAN